jgi:hypothetical protein
MCLLAAGASDQRSLAFSLDVAASAPVVTLAPGQQRCQGPIRVQAASDGLHLWTESAGPLSAPIRVTARRWPAGPVLTDGSLPVPSGVPAVRLVRMASLLPAGESVAICVRNRARQSVSFLGSAAGLHSGAVVGAPTPSAMAMTFQSTRPRSLLASLSTSFDRAALWHPAWVGPWTFWLLLSLLVSSFAVAGLAVIGAASADAAAADPQ